MLAAMQVNDLQYQQAFQELQLSNAVGMNA
jgi:hypothetical protein